MFYIKEIINYLKDKYYKLRFLVFYNLSENNGNYFRTIFFFLYHFFTLYFFFSTVFTFLKYIGYIIKNPKKVYVHFDNHMFLISPFYWIRALNLKEYGIKGTSELMSLGKCNLKQFWSYNYLSFFSFWNYKSNFLMFCSITFVTTFSVWISKHNDISILIFFLILLSTKSFHYFSYVFQNYNALGWSISPIYIYCISNNLLVCSLITFLLLSITSFTVSVLLILVTIPLAIETGNPQLCFISFFGTLLLFIQISIKIGFKDIIKHFVSVLKSIGAFSKRNTKYNRNKVSFNFFIFRVILLLLFGVYLYYYKSLISLTSLSIVFIIFINFKIIRFLDNQSIDMIILLYSTYILFEYGIINIFIIPIYFILNYFLFFKIITDKFIKDPISHEELKESLNMFLSVVPDNSKIFFKFNDPNNCYDKCFGNQRFLIDYPVYYSTKRNIHLFPDFSAVFDNNSMNSISIWADSVSETISQLKNFKTSYCIVSQENITELDTKWQNSGFSKISEFCWKKFLLSSNLNMEQWYYGKPKWFLLKYNHI